jgi:hypothetical protein
MDHPHRDFFEFFQSEFVTQFHGGVIFPLSTLGLGENDQ